MRACTSTEAQIQMTKINSIFDFHRSEISEIKLKRTDTVELVSQKNLHVDYRKGCTCLHLI